MADVIKPVEDNHRPAYEKVAAQIAELISSTNLKSGDRLPSEHELGERLGVSRTVIREAIKVLAAIGLVYTRKGSGLYVANQAASFTSMTMVLDSMVPLDPTVVVSLYEFRLLIEVPAARLAAKHITPRELRSLREALALNRSSAEMQERQQFRDSDASFHCAIAEASHNPFLASSVASIARVQGWVFDIASSSTPAWLLTTVEQHTAVFEAIQEGEPDAAAQAMQVHLEWAQAGYQLEVRRRLTMKADK